MKTFVLCVFILFSAESAVFAEIKPPSNIRKAIEKGTRNSDGTPGSKYWQNKASYILNVDFEPSTGELQGKGSVLYSNNSPDTLKSIIFRLYQNMYKPEMPRNIQLAPEETTDGIIITSLSIQNIVYNLNDKQNAILDKTNLIIRLNPSAFIAPNSSADITVSWKLTMPQAATIRFGKINDGEYFVALWYPQIAVYDDIDGWDRFTYNGEQEFYNDKNDFEVNVTLPASHGMWATGDLVNPEEVFAPEFLERYKKALTLKEKITIISKEEAGSSAIYNSNNKTNIWKFKAAGVPDFAFGTGINFRWEAGMVSCENGEDVFVNTVYRKESEDYEPVWEIAAKTVQYFSNEFPAIAFPYNKVTVFNGRDDYGGGMEWPMIVNDPSYEGRRMTVWVTVHELAHMYLPFYLGTNERKYAWMDEGWAVMSSYDVQTRLDSSLNLRKLYASAYIRFGGNEMELPPMIPTMMLNGNTQQFANYIRSAFTLDYLRETLTPALFDDILRKFMKQWAGLHPTAYDFLNYFSINSGSSLDWYFKPWLFENKYPDMNITDASLTENMLTLKITNIGGMPMPLQFTMTDSEGRTEQKRFSPMVWKNNPDVCEIVIQVNNGVKKIELGSASIPDTNPKDNKWLFNE